VALIAKPLITVAMGEKWLPASLVVEFLASVFALQTIGSLAQPLGMASGRTRTLFIRDVQLFAIRVPCILAGLYFGGLMGVLVARVFTGLSGIFINMLVVRGLIGLRLREQMAVNARFLLGAAVMAGAVVGIQEYLAFGAAGLEPLQEILWSVLVGAACYTTTCLVVWLLAGKPYGPEQEALRLIGAIRSRAVSKRKGVPGE
jgi:O-antigen/teichoic acid export membrane protein